MIKEIMFSVWGALWVALDNIGNMPVKEFIKKSWSLMLSALAVLGFCFIVFALLVAGWATL